VKVQALIPCFNESNFINDCISSLLDSEVPEFVDFEILVSDNASTDNTAEIVSILGSKNSKVKLFKQQQNIGARKNWLFLVNQSDADWIFFIDAHDFVEKGYIAKAISSSAASQSATIGREIENWVLETGTFKKDHSGYYKFSPNKSLRVIQSVLYLGHNTICHALIPRKTIENAILENSKVLSFDLLVTYLFLSQVNLQYMEKKYFRRYIPNLDGEYSAPNSAGVVESRQTRVSGTTSENLDDSLLAVEFRRLMSDRHSSLLISICSRILIMKHSKNGLQKILFRAIRWSFGVLTPWKAWVLYANEA